MGHSQYTDLYAIHRCPTKWVIAAQIVITAILYTHALSVIKLES
jgi:hypothetical protein